LRGTLCYENIPKEVKENIFHGAVLSYGGKMQTRTEKNCGIKSGKLGVIKIYSGGRGRQRRNEAPWEKCTLFHKPQEQKTRH
jgi:hypothetical protein